MKMNLLKFHVLLINLISFILLTCNSNVNLNKQFGTLHNRIEFFNADTCEFKIDSISLPFSSTIQYLDDSKNGYFTYFNGYNASVYFYDYLTKRYLFKWRSKIDTIKVDSYYLVNLDSIFLYNTQKSILYLFDSSGYLVNIYNFAHLWPDSVILPFPYLKTKAPLTKTSEAIILSGYQAGEFPGEDLDRRIIEKFDLKSNLLSFELNSPKLYNEFNWGYTYFYNLSYTCNLKKELIIVSFPILHEICVYNLRNKTTSYYYAGSNFIKQLNPFSKNKKIFPDSNERLKYFLLNPSYGAIYYDRYSDLYFRFAALPLNVFDSNFREEWKHRKYALIVLNKNFEYLGEIILSDIIPDNCFITPKGINIQTESNESLMKFKIVSYKLH
jgi:hypothetical protein